MEERRSTQASEVEPGQAPWGMQITILSATRRNFPETATTRRNEGTVPPG